MKAAKRCVGALSTVLVVVFLAGCGDETGPNAGVAGNYSLIGVNGHTPPVTLIDTVVEDSSQEDRHIFLEIMSGTVDLGSRGTYGWSLTADSTFADESTYLLRDAGDYTVDGSSVILTSYNSLPRDTAAINGQTLTFSGSHPDYGDFDLTFRKEATDDNGIY